MNSVSMNIPEQIKTVYKQASCLYTQIQIEKELDRLAIEIHQTLSDKNPLLLCIMIGGLVLTGNLLPRLDFPLELNYLHATRYQGKFSGGKLNWKVKPSVALKDRIILITDDILDQGLTLQAIVDYCYTEGAKKVFTAVLLDKRESRVTDGLPLADFTGLVIPNQFVFGYGLDYKEYLRNAPGIFVADLEHQS